MQIAVLLAWTVGWTGWVCAWQAPPAAPTAEAPATAAAPTTAPAETVPAETVPAATAAPATGATPAPATGQATTPAPAGEPPVPPPAVAAESAQPAAGQPAAPAEPGKAETSQPNSGKAAGGAVGDTDFKPIRIEPWEFSPYKIQVWMAAEAGPDLSPEVMAELRSDLITRCDATIGAPFSLAVVEPPPHLYHTVAMCPELLTDSAIIAFDKKLMKLDKLILVKVSQTDLEYRVWVREYDCHTRQWAPPATRATRQRQLLPWTVLDTLLAGFGPLMRIEDGQGKTCVVRGRATGLVTSTTSPVFVDKGDVLQPIFRQNDRYGEPMPGKIEALPFTFLQVTSHDELNPSLFYCNVHSGMRSPIHGRSTTNSRRERWATKVRPRFESTTLYVESKPFKRGEVKQLLAGMEVFAKIPEPEPPRDLTEEERREADKKNPAELMGVTDWRGSMTLRPGGPLLRIMYLKNGGLLLARLPIVAGWNEKLVAEIPDDNPRLQAEGFVRGMNSEVTDLVVQRQLIAIRMRRKMGEGKLDEAEKLFEEFRNLKSLNDLQQMLNVQLQRQKPTTSVAVKQRIDKLYSDERELLAKYIDAELQTKLLAELTEARANPVPVEEAEAVPEKKADLPPALQPAGGAAPPAGVPAAGAPAAGAPAAGAPAAGVPAGTAAPSGLVPGGMVTGGGAPATPTPPPPPSSAP